MALITQIIRILALLGFVLNLHFIYTHHFKEPKHRHTKLCAGNKCKIMAESRYAHIFYIPNYVLSVIYYAGLFIMSLTPYFAQENLRAAMLGLTWFVAGMSVYLTYFLVFKLRTRCIVCFSSAIINLLIATLYPFI